MRQQKRQHSPEKLKLHPRNRHRGRYDFKTLIVRCPELAEFVIFNLYGEEYDDFSNPKAVKILIFFLSKMLTKHRFLRVTMIYLWNRG